MYGRRGMGAAACNWTDEFGDCIAPGTGDTVVLPSGLRVKIGAAAAGAKSTDTFSAFLNENGKWIAMGAAALIGLSFLKR